MVRIQEEVMSIFAWIGLIWCIGMSVVLFLMMCLCIISGRAERDIEQWKDRE